MDTILTVLAMVLGGFIFVLAVGWLGFRLLPRRTTPDEAAVSPPPVHPLRPSLPESVQRFFNANFGAEIPAPETVIAWGSGRFLAVQFPLLGKMQVPMRWVMTLVPGKTFTWQVRFFWFHRQFMAGSEGYDGRRGKYQMGTTIETNENMDQSEHVLLWFYTLLLAPGAILPNRHVIAQAEGGNRFRLEVPTPFGGKRPYTLEVDADARLTRIATRRPTLRTGKDLSFFALLADHQEFDGAGRLPATVQVAWENDFYMTLNLEGVRYAGMASE